MNILEKKENRITDKVLIRTLTTSVIGMLLCMAGLAGTTWAWFTVQINTGPNTMRFAEYAVQMNIVSETGERYSGTTAGRTREQTLTSGNYTVELTMTMGDVVDAEGYCELRFTHGENVDETFYTGKLSAADTFRFDLKVDNEVSSTVTVSPCWGELPQFGEDEKNRMIGERGLHITALGVEQMQDSEGTEGDDETSTDENSTENGNGAAEGDGNQEESEENTTGDGENPTGLSDESVE